MGCCGSSGPKLVRRSTSKGAVKKAQATPVTSIYPKSIQRIIKTSTPKVTPTVQKAMVRAAGIKNCPTCGTPVTTVLAGSGSRKRRICKSCGKQFLS